MLRVAQLAIWPITAYAMAAWRHGTFKRQWRGGASASAENACGRALTGVYQRLLPRHQAVGLTAWQKRAASAREWRVISSSGA